MIQFTVLEQADASNTSVFDGETTTAATSAELASLGDFLRVQNHKSDKVHLLHPGTLEKAALVA